MEKKFYSIKVVNVFLYLGLFFILCFCFGYSISWIYKFDFMSMLYVTMPNVLLGVISFFTYGVLCDNIVNKKKEKVYKEDVVFEILSLQKIG